MFATLQVSSSPEEPCSHFFDYRESGEEVEQFPWGETISEAVPHKECDWKS